MLLHLSPTPSTIRRSESCQRGLAKKTQLLLGGELRERLRYAVRRQPLKAIRLFILVPDVVVCREEVVIDDWMSILVEKRKFRIGCRSALVLRPVEFVAARILAFLALRRKEDRIVVALRIVVWLVLVVLPLLYKQYTRFRAGMRLECIAVQPDHGKDTAVFRDESADVLIRRIVEASLRKDDGHASTGTEEVDVALDEKNVAPDAALRLAVLVAEVVTRQQLPFLDFSCERRIRHDDVKLEIMVRVAVYFELAEFLVTLVVSVNPILFLCHRIPASEVEGVQMQNVRMTVACDEVQRPRNADGLFVEVNREHFLADVVGFLVSFRRGGEKMADWLVRGKLHLAPHMEDGMHRKARRTSRRVDHRLGRLRGEHAHAHVDDIARREILAFLALRRLTHQVFKSIVHHVKVRVEQLDGFKRCYAD